MAAADKDTIYIDIDDEITGIIDKLKASEGKVVALVLPKRASVFQSIVNMKLLKRAGDDSNKHLVLITSEAGLLPLAGAAGVHVAKTLTSKPEVPAGPGELDDGEEEIAEDPGTSDANPDPAKPVGELAGGAAAADGVETLVLDDEAVPPEAAGAPKDPKTFEPPVKKAKKDKKLHVPDFDRFRLLLVLGALGVIVLIVGLIFAIKVLPKATINIDTNAVSFDTNLNLSLNTATKTLDPEAHALPAKVDQQQKTFNQQVTTTGQKNLGNKASGTVTLTNCSQSDDITLPGGSGLSSGGNTFITRSSVVVPASSFKKGACQNDGKANVDVVAQSGGAAYNNATAFSVPGQGVLSGVGSTSGGTDNITQVVSQSDIDNAKSKITANNTDPVKSSIKNQLTQDGFLPIEATFAAGTPTVSSSAKAGDPATTVTVTETITYTMFGVHKADLRTLVENSVNTQIDPTKQKILNDGIDQAKFGVDSATATTAQLTMETTASAGPDIDTEGIKQAAAGKKSGEVKSDLEGQPGIKGVDVNLSPFWVSSIPHKTDKIKVVIAKPKPAANNNANDQ